MSCYYPNGDLSTDGDVPCSTSGYGPCCPLNWECESNGLCYLANEGYYGRYTCTDQSWQSSSCPQICTHDLTAAGNEAVLECTSGSYCCDANRPELSGGTACCEASTSRFSLAALPLLPPYNSNSNGGSGGDGGGSAQASSTTPPPLSSTLALPASQSSTYTPPPPPSSTYTHPPPPPSTSSIAAHTSNTPPPSSIPPSNTPTSAIQSTASSTSTSSPTTTSRSPTTTPNSSSLVISVILSTQIVTSDGSPSTLLTSTTSNIAEPASSQSLCPSSNCTQRSKTAPSHVGLEAGIPVAVSFVLSALAIFFFYRRSKRSRDSHPTPRNLQSDAEPKNPISSPFPHSPSTAPPSYRGSTLIGTQTQHPHSFELPGSPTVGTFRDSRGSELMGSTGTGVPTSPGQSELPAMREAGAGNTNRAELPGNIYRPYRPPGWSS